MVTMRTYLKMLACACATLLLTVSAMAATPTSATKALNRFYREVHTFHARFHQVQRDDSGTVMQQSSGRFTIERPGRFRWIYEKPYKQVIVSDGQTLWTYDKDLAQVTQRPVGSALKGTPAQLLSGGEGLSQAFSIESQGDKNGLSWVKLTPKSNQSDFKSVSLGFNNGQLSAMVLHDSLGDVSHITFSEVQINAPVASDTFHFHVPKGVEVVH